MTPPDDLRGMFDFMRQQNLSEHPDIFKDSLITSISDLGNSPEISKRGLLRFIAYGLKDYLGRVGVESEISVMENRQMTKAGIENIVKASGRSVGDLITNEFAAYCIIDTDLGDKLEHMDKRVRHILFQENTLLGFTYDSGDPAVSRKILMGVPLKDFRYGDFKNSEWFNLTEGERICYPVFAPTSADEIAYVEYFIHIRNVGEMDFDNDLLRKVRTILHTGANAINVKELLEDRLILNRAKEMISMADAHLDGLGQVCHALNNDLGVMQLLVCPESDSVDIEKAGSRISAAIEKNNGIHRGARAFQRVIGAFFDNPVNYSLEKSDTDDVEIVSFLDSYFLDLTNDKSFNDYITFSYHNKSQGASVLRDVDKSKIKLFFDNIVYNCYNRYKEIAQPGKLEIELSMKFGQPYVNISDQGKGFSEEKFCDLKNAGKCLSSRRENEEYGQGMADILSIALESHITMLLRNNVGSGVEYMLYFGDRTKEGSVSFI